MIAKLSTEAQRELAALGPNETLLIDFNDDSTCTARRVLSNIIGSLSAEFTDDFAMDDVPEQEAE